MVGFGQWCCRMGEKIVGREWWGRKVCRRVREMEFEFDLTMEMRLEFELELNEKRRILLSVRWCC